jgi:hypothetical protein
METVEPWQTVKVGEGSVAVKHPWPLPLKGIKAMKITAKQMLRMLPQIEQLAILNPTIGLNKFRRISVDFRITNEE